MFMDRQSLEFEPTMQQLFALLSPSANTWENYLSAMSLYTDFTEKTPTELISEATADIRAGKIMIERGVFSTLPRFRQYLSTRKSPQAGRPLAPGTIQKYMSIVCSFYGYFYIEMPKQPRSKQRVQPIKEHTKRADKEEIRQAHYFANPRDKALSLCGISSGMGSAELSSLTLKAFWEGYDKETGITTFDMRRKKAGVDFITFISPEASQAVLQYLEWRDRPPKSQNKADIEEYQKRKTTADSYLFVSERVAQQYLNSDFHEMPREELRKMNGGAITKVYSRLSRAAGINTDKGMYNTFRSHNMRKFFNSNLKNAGCDGDLVEYFMGHTLGSTKRAYYEGDPKQLREIYKKFLPYITIRKELDISESKEYLAKVEENEKLKVIAIKSTLERSELEEIRAQNEAMQAELEEMKEFNKAMQAILADPKIKEKLKELL